MRIALLGGSFDPPHRAHRQVLEFLLNSGKYNQVWVLPSLKPPWKDRASSYVQRLAMCHLAFDPLGTRVRVSDEEKTLSGFTIDLIRHLQKKYPKLNFTFVGGSDLQSGLSHWKESETLKKLLEFDFLPRPPDPNSRFLDLSSSQIRERIRNEEHWEDFVEPEVAHYIKTQALYLT